MNNISQIAVQEFELYTVEAFLEAAELGVERHETYDTGILTDPEEGRCILMEVLERI